MADYRNPGDDRALRFGEKGGKDREIPVRHDLTAWLNEYIAAAGIAEEPKTPPLPRRRPPTYGCDRFRLPCPLHAPDHEAVASERRLAALVLLAQLPGDG